MYLQEVKTAANKMITQYEKYYYYYNNYNNYNNNYSNNNNDNNNDDDDNNDNNNGLWQIVSSKMGFFIYNIYIIAGFQGNAILKIDKKNKNRSVDIV